jgi:membrane fusion protein, multidrug efflux system
MILLLTRWSVVDALTAPTHSFGVLAMRLCQPRLSFSLLAVAGVLVACSKPEPVQDPVRAVKVVQVAPQVPEFEAEYAGEVRARSESRLGFRVGGKLLSRAAEVGVRVRPGQVLAQLDPSDLQLAVQAANAQVQAAQTQLDLAVADHARYAELRAQNFISGAELERREATLKAARAALDQAKAQGGVQANQKGYAMLVADKAGVVVAVDAEPGQVLAAGTSVVRVAYDGPRDVVVSVPEQRVTSVVPGLPAHVRLWAGGSAQAAKVREVSASADPVSRTYAVKLALADGVQVPLGATAYARIPLSGVVAPPLLKLPTSALRQQGQGSAVWLFDPATRTVKSQPVVVATADGNQAVIASGLKGGDQVVVAGVHVLTDGQAVTLFQEKIEPKQTPALAGIDKSATAVKAQP